MPGDRLGQFGGDAQAEFPVLRVITAGVMARPVRRSVAIGMGDQDFGIAFAHPDRRRGGWRADADLDPGLVAHVHGAQQPREIEAAFGGFHQPPGEFERAHQVESQFAHLRQVTWPFRFGPEFWIPGGAEPDAFVAGEFGGGGMRCGGGRRGGLVHAAGECPVTARQASRRSHRRKNLLARCRRICRSRSGVGSTHDPDRGDRPSAQGFLPVEPMQLSEVGVRMYIRSPSKTGGPSTSFSSLFLATISPSG